MAEPLYEQIYRSLRTSIDTGQLRPGDRLPSGRVLAEQWSVARNTVVKAMDVLREQGLIRAHRGARFVVAEVGTQKAAGPDDLRAHIAERIRAELVCCDVFDRDRGTPRAGSEHAICFYGEYAARIAEQVPAGETGGHPCAPCGETYVAPCTLHRVI